MTPPTGNGGLQQVSKGVVAKGPHTEAGYSPGHYQSWREMGTAHQPSRLVEGGLGLVLGSLREAGAPAAGR